MSEKKSNTRIFKMEIDHIIPCYLFDLTKIEHQLVCFNYKNLQPLWDKENATKNKYIDFEIDINEYVKNFIFVTQ